MDLSPEKLESLATQGIQKESISILKLSPKTFYLITLILIFPLSFAILAYGFFIDVADLIDRLQGYSMGYYLLASDAKYWTHLLIFNFFYFIFLFTFSLLSTAAVVFTVACLYTSKSVSFSSTLYAIPKVFKRLFITFLWVSLFIFFSSLVLIIFACFLHVLAHRSILLALIMSTLLGFSYLLHSTILVLWHLANVVSVLEPVYGLAAIRKSYELVKGKFGMTSLFQLSNHLICFVVWYMFEMLVVIGGDMFGIGLLTKIVVCVFLSALLAIVNLVDLLVQSVLYYYCKSYHRQGIDIPQLHDLLGEYIGEYVPLKSSIQMESLDT